MSINRVAKFGIVVDNMGRNDLTLSILNNLNRVMATDPLLSPTVFSLEVAPALSVIPCPVMSFNEIWCFTYDVLVTSYSAAKALLNVPGPKKLFFYLHELPTVTKQNYFEIREVICNPRFTLLCRSQLHSDILRSNYGRKNIEVISEGEMLDLLLGIEKEVINA